MHFVLAMKENCLFEILYRRVLNEGNAEQVMEVVVLVKRCLSLKGEERPTMKEVALELEGLKAMEKPPHVKGNMSSEETYSVNQMMIVSVVLIVILHVTTV
ncbi:wall-associated receptor kinase-like 4 [Quercus suber]|uniref:Wall-associated receptor kinase-like 4 n=1 Tax=Quercus suber TaxID=58331 RepID=A0AAW0JMV5_QUESU